jgi:DNA polymerase-3 subunit beta
MKLACTQENLHRGLNIVGRMVSRNATLPVLGNVLLKAEPGGLRMIATDLELGVSCLVGGKIEEKGQITIPARLLSEYVSQLPKERVGISVTGKELNLECEGSKAQIKGISADEFPLIPKVEGVFKSSLPAQKLKKAIIQTVFAVAHDESRPELTGVYMQFEKDSCTLAATDSFRLTEATIACGPNVPKKMIIPAKTLAELARIIEDEDATVNVQASDNQVLFAYHDVELISRLLEGQYPEYKDIIPKELPTKVTADREEFLTAVKTAGLFSKTSAQDVVIVIDPTKKQLSISAEASQVGGHSQELPVKIAGPADKVVFNYRYLVEGLNAFTGEEVIFETGGATSPGKLTSSKDEQYLYIVMPIHL